MSLLRKVVNWFRPTVTLEVTVAGKKVEILSKNKSKDKAQAFADANMILCGTCGEPMFPGDPIWLNHTRNPYLFDKPGVLVIGEGESRDLVSCLRWNCCPTAGAMCGRLLEDKKIARFESPIEKALRTGEPVIVSDVDDYKG